MTTEVRTLNEPSTALVALGERLGFYEVMSETPVTAAALAERTGTPTRFVRDWLADQAGEGYLTYDAPTDRYANWCSLPRSN